MFSVTNSIPIRNSYWVNPEHFMAGEHPCKGSAYASRKKLRWLMDHKINFIVDLTEIGEADTYYPQYIAETESVSNSRITYQRFPIQDWSAPPPDKIIEILDTLDRALAGGNNIYLHCYGGMGRTGMIVGCYLIRHGMPGNLALDKIREFRKGIPGEQKRSPETERQRKMVFEWIKGQ